MTLKHFQGAGVLALGFALCLGANPSQAFQPATPQSQYEIPLRQFNLHGFTNPVIASAKDQAMRAFEIKNGGVWNVYSWNPQTNSPSIFDGSGVQASAAFTSANEAVAVARGVVTQNPDVFKARVGDLRFDSAPKGRGKQSVIFQQVYKGIDVIGGRVHTIFTEGGRFFTGGSDFYSGINLDVKPSVLQTMAEEIAAHALPFDPATDRIESGTRLFILPVPISETQVEHHLVWKITVRTENPLGKWVSHVDANSGQVVYRYNDIHFANFVGDADGDVHPATYCNGTETQDFKYLRVQVAGVGNANTDQNGDWTVPYPGTDARTVTADLYGPYVDVNCVQAGCTQGTATGSATPGVPFNVHFSNTNSRADERDVFTAVNDIHDFISLFDPTFPYINARIIGRVGVPGSCNAYYDGSINFYNAGGACANTGEIQGVVHHEYGHGIQASILGGQGNEGLGEGNGDIIANLLTQESIIGRGFYAGNCTAGIRNSDNGFQYPDDVVGQEIHFAGQTIAGFHWDQMVLFQGEMGQQAGRDLTGELWHFGRVLEHPTNQPAQVHSVFVADDDNGNLSDGTPHYDVICQAASNHGFACPEILTGVIIVHTPLITSVIEGDRNVDATITTTDGTLVLANMYVDYRVNGGSFNRVPMAQIGLSDYRAVIPNLQEPAEVEYYLHAENSLGETRNDPALAPVILHAFDVPTLLDSQEAANGWTVNPDGTDNATTGQWTRVDPNGTGAQPENDYTPAPGVFCWVTGQGSVGGGAGDQDIDAGTVTLQSVEYDLTGAFSARAKIFYWYSNDQGNAPGADTWIMQVRNNGGAWQNVLSTLTSTNSWVPLNVDLLALFGGSLGNVQFKFIASDLGQGSLVEAAIDDLEILADLDGSSAVGDPVSDTPRFALGGATPTPFAGMTNIHFQVPTSTAVRITVYDVGGRAVKTVANGSFTAGVHDVAWDGRDELGHPVASGVYFYRMMAEGFVANRSTVLQR